MTHTKAALELYKVVYQIWNSMELDIKSGKFLIFFYSISCIVVK